MKLKHMCNGLLFTAVLAWSGGLVAQMGLPNNQPTQPNQPSQPNNGMGSVAGMAGAMSGGNTTLDPEAQMAKDKMFLHAAAEGGLAEVQLGKLAAQKGGGDDVKQFGQKMADDHTALNNDLKPFADEMGVRVPAKLGKDDRAEYDKLSALSGDDFDKEYLAYMVKDHHKDLREFRMEAATTQDASLKTAVTKGAAVIREHTMMVDKLARSKGLVVPGRGPVQAAPPPPPPL